MLTACLLVDREFPDLPQYLSYLLLACIASILKIKLPKIRGTMSVNFVFILIGVAQLTPTETVLLGCAPALIQSFWRARKRPTVAQALFNIATLVTSTAIAFFISHAMEPGGSAPVRMAIAVCAFFILNTGIVSLVVSLTEGQPVRKVWRQCYLWSFPYYLVGSAIACAITMSSRSVGWRSSLLMLPLMYMVYSYYRLYLGQVSEAGALSKS